MRWFVGSAVFAVICLLAFAAAAARGDVAHPWYSVVPPLVAVTLAFITRRLFLSLIAAVAAGGLLGTVGKSPGALSWGCEGIGQGAKYVVQTIYNVDGGELGFERFNVSNLEILLFVVLIMPMISVTIVSGGLQGVVVWLMRFARSARSTQLVTMAAGLVIFIDDYANTMIVGPTLRPVTDRQRISREKLAFLVDATAAPVAGIALVGTWIGYEVGLLSDIARSLGLAKGGYEVFLDALGFRFYCFGMLAFCFFNAYSGQDFGPMAAAQRRARDTGKLLDEDASLMSFPLAGLGTAHTRTRDPARP